MSSQKGVSQRACQYWIEFSGVILHRLKSRCKWYIPSSVPSVFHDEIFTGIFHATSAETAGMSRIMCNTLNPAPKFKPWCCKQWSSFLKWKCVGRNGLSVCALRSQCRSVITVWVEPEGVRGQVCFDISSHSSETEPCCQMKGRAVRTPDSHWEIIHSPLWMSTSTAASVPVSSHANSPEPPYPALPLFTSSAFTSSGVHCDASKCVRLSSRHEWFLRSCVLLRRVCCYFTRALWNQLHFILRSCSHY